MGVSKRLENRDVYRCRSGVPDFNKDAGKLLNDCIARLVQAMKSVELDGVESRKRIENFVIDRMGVYERMYYAIDPVAFDVLLDLEKSNNVSRDKLSEGGDV